MASIVRNASVTARWLAATCLLAVLVAWTPGRAAPADAPFDYTWREDYFASGDGTRLHADILRDPGVPESAKQPVILTVSPYTNHSSQTTDSYGPFKQPPSNRFFDFLKLGKVLQRGYTYVMVDLRGTGGSAGCTDWGGPGEQADVKAAVEWAGAQPWSTGRVGVIGKSYDGWTGLMAIANRPEHLAAVVSMEPVFDGYRYLYTDGVRYSNSFATPALFVADDATPGTLNDTIDYHLNGNQPNAACYALYYTGQQNDDAESPFWQARELIKKSRGATTPLFLTQGFLETNTKPDGAFAYFDGMAGPKRAWFGQFDHVRAWERSGDEFEAGRSGFIDEAMRFLDRYVKGIAPVKDDPLVVVQGVDGRYRAENAWPPRDALALSTKLRTGEYIDSGTNFGWGSNRNPRKRLWSISDPLPYRVHLSGEPALTATVTAIVPRTNLAVNVYDIDPKGLTYMISRGTTLLRDAGTTTVEVPMYGQDWPIPAGHRIGVAISGANADWWTHIPTMTTVTVERATIALPFLRIARTSFLDGKAGPRLDSMLENESFWVFEDQIAAAKTAFAIPEPMTSGKSAVLPAKTSRKPAATGPSLPATGVPAASAAGYALIGLSVAAWGFSRRSSGRRRPG